LSDDHRQRMYDLIHRLWQEAPTLPGITQTPAIEAVVMFSNGHTVRGSLSETPEGLLRLLSPGTDPHDRPLLVEQFFDYDAVMVVALPREITTEVKRIVIPQRSS
jgi:hypothetical protein